MSDIDYKKKYLKYKKKHILNKKINQKGGENHQSVIRKDGDNISFPNGFPDLQTNGDYHVIHAYDEQLTSSRVMNAKVRQLHTWLNFTFPQATPPQGDNNVNKAAAIYTSDQRENIIDLVNWILDPIDN